MKKIVLFIIPIIFLSAYFYSTKVVVYGKVSHKKTGEALPFASVTAKQNNKIISGTNTNFDGEYTLEVKPGEYEFEASYIGYSSIREKRKILNTSSEKLNFEMSEGSTMDEVIIREFSLPSAKIYTDLSANRLHSKDLASKKTEFTIESSNAFLATTRMEQYTEEYFPRAGQITAAEWNDLHNWQEWKDLLQDEEYRAMQDHWSMFPNERYAVFITNEYTYPIPNCKVHLISDKGDLIWSAQTDTHGKAELWNNVSHKGFKANHIEVEYESINRKIKQIKQIDKGTNHLSLNVACPEKVQTEIMFVVDATGSMGDEISFLQSEISDVLYQCSSMKNIENIRVGSVFYRDDYEDYLTKISPLTDELDQTVRFIEEQSAAGGGDFPEAVDRALEKAVQQNWNPMAANKIIFLLLDAPPHGHEKSMNSIRAQIKIAAEKGIKIIPITASGIDRETEFLMKFMAMLTNGTYVFITDDSGIGNTHLTPVVEDYEIEKLNDLIIRLIKEYSNLSSCEQEEEEEEDLFIDTELTWNFFPNPAKSIINLDISSDIDAVTVRSASGKIVFRSDKFEKGKHQINLSNLVSGVYTISIRKSEKIETKKLIMIDR